jgi:hypothetical protein
VQGFLLKDNPGACACGNGSLNCLLDGRSVIGLSAARCPKTSDPKTDGEATTCRKQDEDEC